MWDYWKKLLYFYLHAKAALSFQISSSSEHGASTILNLYGSWQNAAQCLIVTWVLIQITIAAVGVVCEGGGCSECFSSIYLLGRATADDISV